MYLKLVWCLFFVILFTGVRSQRVWGPSGYNTGFSNSWTPNGFSNQNVGSWGSSKPNPSVFGNNQFNTPFGLNTNNKPIEQPSYGSLYNDKPAWNSDRPGKSNSGISESVFNTRKPDKEKLELINVPNTNTFSSSNNDNLSPWGSSNDNSKKSEWNSNNNNADTSLSNSFFSASNDFSSFGSGNQTPKPNKKPNSNSFSSESNNEFLSSWGLNKPSENDKNSNIFNNNNKPIGNDIPVDSDYEDNSVYSWNTNNKEKSKPNINTWKTTTSKPTKNNNKSSSWNQNENINKQEESNKQDNKKTIVDTSILDELDKNDWYFGKESNYPQPPFRSVLDINVSELWNFDKNRKSNKNSKDRRNKESNNRRRNRQAGDGEGGIQCECVSVTLCDEEDMIVTQEDIEYDWRPLEAFRCQQSSEVCCTNPKIRLSNRANIDEEKSLYCGQRRFQKSSFGAVSDDFVDAGEFPWILKLQSLEINCSASLIHPKLALTAAHCVSNVEASDLSLKAGIWNDNEEPPQIQKVSRIILHPAYSSQNPRNDIALLVLETGFKLNDNINTICLPFANNKWNLDECVVAGWGLRKLNGDVVQVLEKRAVEFIPQPECQNIILVTDLWRNYILHDSFVCAREKAGSNACLENEGGPVMCPNQKEPNTYLQIGIVSSGINCDNFGRPGIFTNVLKFLDWINKNHFDLGLNYDLDIRSL